MPGRATPQPTNMSGISSRGDDRQTMVFDDAIGIQKDLFGRREDLMMFWAERLGNGSSKRDC